MVWGFHSLCQAKVIHWVYWNQCLMELVGRWQCGICWLTPLRFHARREGMSCDWTWISRPQFGLGWLFGKKNIHWKDCCSSWSSNPFPLDAKNWLIRKGPDAGKDWRQKKKRVPEDRWLDGTSDSMDMNLNKCQEITKDRGTWHVAVHKVTKSQTRLSNWTTKQQASWVVSLQKT